MKSHTLHAWPIWNMGLSVKSKIRSISINYGYWIIMSIVCLFEKANWYYYPQLFGKFLHPSQCIQAKCYIQLECQICSIMNLPEKSQNLVTKKWVNKSQHCNYKNPNIMIKDAFWKRKFLELSKKALLTYDRCKVLRCVYMVLESNQALQLKDKMCRAVDIQTPAIIKN